MSHYTSSPGTLLKEDFQDITVKVCGLETVTTILTTTPSYFYLYKTGPFKPVPPPSTILTWFANDDVTIISDPTGQDCPITGFNLYSPFSIPYTGTDVVVTFSPPELEIKTDRNYKKSFWIEAYTRAGKAASQQIDVWVCGQEIINATVTELVVFVPYYEPGTNKTIENYLPPLIDSNDTICPLIEYKLFGQDGFTLQKIPYTDNLVWTNFTSKNIYFSTSKPGRSIMFLQAKSTGNVIGYLKIDIEVCGTEVIQLIPYKKTKLYLEYLQFTGIHNIQTVREHMYQTLLQVNSSRCVIFYNLTQIVYWNKDVSDYRPYLGKTIVFDLASEQLFVNTTNATYLEVFLRIKANVSSPFYLPVIVNIV